MQVRRILIVNAFSPNAGDMAILQATLLHLSTVFPDAGVSVHCSHPELSRKFFKDCRTAIRGYIWPSFKDGPPGFLEAAAAFSLFSWNFLRLLSSRVFGKLLISEDDRTLRDYVEADLVIGIGGGYMSWDYGFLRPYCDYVLAKMLGKKLVLYGPSIGPFGGTVNRLISKAVLSLPDLIILREDRSTANLRELGIRARTTADVAFSLPLLPHKRGKNSRPRIAICTAKWPFTYRSTADPYLRFIAGLAKKLSDGGHEVVFIPSTLEDISLNASLKPHLPERVILIEELYSPDRLAKFLSGCDFLVSSRMHPIILASRSGTPFASVGWEYKMGEMADLLCGRRCFLDAASLDESSEEKVLTLFGSRDKLGAAIAERMPSIRERSLKSMEMLRESAGGW